MALIPILFTAFVLTVWREEWGILFFMFCFPLINNLPYFFGIYEDTPHAPTALILFLVFFMGWLIVLYNTRIPKILGIYGICGPLTVAIINLIDSTPFLEWLLLFSILAWIIPLALIMLMKTELIPR